MIELAEWGAPIATMIAACMTAANLGSRITGWGFVVFTMGSLMWCYIGITSGQQNLLLTNGFLTAVNIVGVWRWLGRQAKFEDGSRHAATKSSAQNVPTLYSSLSLAGQKFCTQDSIAIGSVVDAMFKHDGNDIAYVVITDGGQAGIAEQLRAVSPDKLQFQHGCVTFRDDEAAFIGHPVLEKDNWPASLPDDLVPSEA